MQNKLLFAPWPELKEYSKRYPYEEMQITKKQKLFFTV